MSEPKSQSLVPTETTDRRAAGADPKLLEILVCPLTRATLSYDAERQESISRAAKLAYPIRDGIPIMLPDERGAWRTEVNPQLFAAYLLITFVLVITPGPIVTLVIATGATRGVRPALATVVGTTLGNALLLTAIALGLSWVLANALILFEVMRWAGAAYLVYLGVQAWRGAARAAEPSAGRRPCPFRPRPRGGADQSQDDRLLHRLPAAVRRPVAAGRAPARRHVRGVDADGGDDRHGLGGRRRPRSRLVHEAVSAPSGWRGCREPC